MPTKETAEAPFSAVRVAWWVLATVGITAALVARVRLLNLPLERDEGEFAYIGQLMLAGVPPYKLAYTMKLPGTSAVYALAMAVFGQTPAGVHLGLLMVNLAAVVLLFFIGRSLFGLIAGSVAAGSYAVLSAMPYVLGLAAHATHFVVVPALAGAFLLLKSEDLKSLHASFWSGFLFGLSFLMKQPGLLLVLFGLTYLVVHDWRCGGRAKRIVFRAGIFCFGASVPLIGTCLILLGVGVSGNFWFWTVSYAQQYGGRLSIVDAWHILTAQFDSFVGSAWPLWIIAPVGFVILVIGIRRYRRQSDFLVLLFLFSLLAVCPGFYFRPHYFILLLPALSLLIAAAVTGAIDFLQPRPLIFQLMLIILIGAAMVWPIWRERDFFFQRPLSDANRMVNGTNPFAEAEKIGDYLRSQTTPDDTVAVLGSEPEIYFYSHRRSATGYIYTYELMEPQPFVHQMQLEMIREIESARPKFLVLVVLNKSWLAVGDSDKTIFRWADRYCDEKYEEVGLVNISDAPSEYYLSGIPSFVKPTEDHILIYRRKT